MYHFLLITEKYNTQMYSSRIFLWRKRSTHRSRVGRTKLKRCRTDPLEPNEGDIAETGSDVALIKTVVNYDFFRRASLPYLKTLLKIMASWQDGSKFSVKYCIIICSGKSENCSPRMSKRKRGQRCPKENVDKAAKLDQENQILARD